MPSSIIVVSIIKICWHVCSCSGPRTSYRWRSITIMSLPCAGTTKPRRHNCIVQPYTYQSLLPPRVSLRRNKNFLFPDHSLHRSDWTHGLSSRMHQMNTDCWHFPSLLTSSLIFWKTKERFPPHRNIYSSEVSTLVRIFRKVCILNDQTSVQKVISYNRHTTF